MQGLEIAEKYWTEYLGMTLKKKFPNCVNRVAAGLVGDGSECYGFDDEISRDHDWGPGFCLWLTMDDYRKFGTAFKLEYEQLPGNFAGFKARKADKRDAGRVGVFEIGAFYRKFIGRETAPQTLKQWFSIPENNLAACTNGKIFFDPSGKFSAIRNKLLRFYPEDIRLFKIATKCVSSAQAGQYNFSRSVHRKEYFAAQYAETKFCADLISLVFLLNKHYAPFYKWMHRGLLSLPILGQFIFQKIGVMAETVDYDEKHAIIEEMSRIVIEELRSEGLSDSQSDFLLDHVPDISRKIENIELRQRCAAKR